MIMLKKCLLATLTGIMVHAPAMAELTVREYYLGPVEAGVISFRAQAVKSTTTTGVAWYIKLLTADAGRTSMDLFTIDEAKGILAAFKELEGVQAAAEASPADIYEVQVTATSKLDVLYRYERSNKKPVYRLVSPGFKLESEYGQVLNKVDIASMIKTIQAALEKIQ